MADKALRNALRKAALERPGTEEGVACEGTTIEKRTVKVGKKAFVFLGVTDLMVKLGPSQAEARRLASTQPERYKVGANGWTTVKLDEASGAPPPGRALLERWIGESYVIMAAAPSRAGRPGTSAKRPKAARVKRAKPTR